MNTRVLGNLDQNIQQLVSLGTGVDQTGRGNGTTCASPTSLTSFPRLRLLPANQRRLHVLSSSYCSSVWTLTSQPQAFVSLVAAVQRQMEI
jgi:hypothetical protein